MLQETVDEGKRSRDSVLSTRQSLEGIFLTFATPLGFRTSDLGWSQLRGRNDNKDHTICVHLFSSLDGRKKENIKNREE
jgi:hypothetical protein